VGAIGSLDRQIKGVKALFSGDPKMCLAEIVSIRATGDTLPMYK
jgi:hypothetical protein